MEAMWWKPWSWWHLWKKHERINRLLRKRRKSMRTKAVWSGTFTFFKYGQQSKGGNLQPWVDAISFITLWTRVILATRLWNAHGSKADFVVGLRKELGESWIEKDQITTSPHSSHFTIDMMAFIHHYCNLDCTTFQELQEKYLAIMLATNPANCDSIQITQTRRTFETWQVGRSE